MNEAGVGSLVSYPYFKKATATDMIKKYYSGLSRETLMKLYDTYRVGHVIKTPYGVMFSNHLYIELYGDNRIEGVVYLVFSAQGLHTSANKNLFRTSKNYLINDSQFD